MKENSITQTWTSAQYREHLRKSANRKNKYNARKTEANGRIYDSKKEASFAGELELRRRAGEIAAYIPQVSLPLAPNSDRRYRADFLVLKPGWENFIEFIDVKGKDTPQSKLKRDLLAENYGIEVIII
jgi:hypothetical protein